jgi:inhibitor of cysteine peptidase
MHTLPRERNLDMQPAGTRRQLHAALRLSHVALLLSAICAPSASAATKVVTDADKGATVQLKTGDVLEVHLKSNPTTGYEWSVDTKSTPLLKLIGQSQTEATQPGVGRPIFQIFKFEATGRGSGVLLLRYARSWEKPSAQDQQFDLQVTIE